MRLRLLRFPCLCLMLALAAPARAALEENEARAAGGYHLTLFAEWPPGSQREGHFNLCVLTENENSAHALAHLNGKTVKGARLVIWRKHPMQDLGACQAVYLSEMSDPLRDHVINKLAGLPVLTIANGDIPVPGAMISLGVAGERVYFDIDLSVVQRVGLRLDAKLLRLARSIAK